MQWRSTDKSMYVVQSGIKNSIDVFCTLRAKPKTVAFKPNELSSFAAFLSPFEDTGKPASILSTPSLSSF